MKSYYNDITNSNLILIKNLQEKVSELKKEINKNKKALIDYNEENLKLREPLDKVSDEIKEYQKLLRERAKDQMALRNSHARLSSLSKAIVNLKLLVKSQDEEYSKVEKERDTLYNSFEETLVRIQQQSEFQNQTLQQRLITAKTNAITLASQTDEIIRSSNLDMGEIENIMLSLNQMITQKEDVIKNLTFQVVKTKKQFNDTLDSVKLRFKALGISEIEINNLGFELEELPPGSTTGPAGLITSL